MAFYYPNVEATGTWQIAGDEFTVVLRQATRPDEESVSVYSRSKICRDEFTFGPSREFGRVHGQQIGESEGLAGGTVYKRAR